jgi:hypothetical protein
MFTMIFRSIFLLLSFLSLASCGSHSLEDFREEGKGVTLELIETLEPIYTREDLLDVVPRLRYLFDKLVNTMIAAREFHEKHPNAEITSPSENDHALSERLRRELNRIYFIEEGSDIIEKCQEAGLNRLDACEKKIEKNGVTRFKPK